MTIKHSFFISTLLVVLLFVSACGNRKDPTGGSADLVKPTVLVVTPSPLQEIGKSIDITFSKTIDKSTTLSGIYFYPSILKKKYSWSGTTLTITIQEPLKPNTNYYLTLYPSIKDDHGNALDQIYTYTFKNGILAQNQLSGHFEFENKEDENLQKTLLLLDSDSLVVWQQNTLSANYIFENLNPGYYVLRSFIDKNDNTRYDMGTEPYVEKKVQLSRSEQVNLFLAYADTTMPRPLTSVFNTNHEMVIQLSEPVKYCPKVSIVRESDREPIAVIASELTNTKLTILTAEVDTSRYEVCLSSLEDSKNNINANVKMFVKGVNTKDNKEPQLLSSYPHNGATVQDLTPTIALQFTEIMSAKNLHCKITEIETKKNIPFTILSDFASKQTIQCKQQLTNYYSYQLTIDKSTCDSSKNTLSKSHEILFMIAKPEKK